MSEKPLYVHQLSITGFRFRSGISDRRFCAEKGSCWRHCAQKKLQYTLERDVGSIPEFEFEEAVQVGC